MGIEFLATTEPIIIASLSVQFPLSSNGRRIPKSIFLKNIVIIEV